MPMYRKISDFKIVSTEKTSDKICLNGERNVYASANEQFVRILQHLAELMRLSNDMFGSIEGDCRNLFQRTKILSAKIKQCQEKVDKLNAKTVTVPVGTLLDPELRRTPSVICNAEATLFASFPRPPFVDRLWLWAGGPSSPAIIPSHKVAPETDGASVTLPRNSTHIYCNPLRVENISQSSLFPGKCKERQKSMTTTVKMPSNVVPIDVSGQTFSRMASFRRSLIHVDFLIRRKKKKDKRRNTVAEGDVKELKDALHNIINDKKQHIRKHNTLSSQEKSIEPELYYNSNISDIKTGTFNITEKNNNTEEKKDGPDFTSNAEASLNHDEENENLPRKNKGLKLDHKNNSTSEIVPKLSFNKKKSKSNIPISTVSAAMSVAVEMRQSNDTQNEDQSSSGNWSCSSDQNSSDSEKPRCGNKSHFQKRVSTEEMLKQVNESKNNERLKGKCCNTLQSGIYVNSRIIKDVDASSSASSENSKTIGEDTTSVCTSTGSDAFIISSDESDDDVVNTGFAQERCSSLTSLSTLSNGSINSILSQTGTEMTSSTGTLTSIGRDRLPTPPPPPPMIIAVTREKDTEKAVSKTVSCVNDMHKDKSTSKQHLFKKSSKQLKKPNISKFSKLEMQQNTRENAKNVLTSLISKSHTKEPQKCKIQGCENKKSSKLHTEPNFDMYGNNSPKNPKQAHAFILENSSLPKEKEIKCLMQSFVPHQSRQDSPKLVYDLEHDSQIGNTIRTLNCTNNLHMQAQNDIPKKYEHHLTVTPVQRHKLNDFISKPSISNYNNEVKHSKYNTITKIRNSNEQMPISPPTENLKLAARVVLDFDGRVIYCTNSLDRKFHNTNLVTNINNNVSSKHLDPYSKISPQTRAESVKNPCSNSYLKSYKPTQTYQHSECLGRFEPKMGNHAEKLQKNIVNMGANVHKTTFSRDTNIELLISADQQAKYESINKIERKSYPSIECDRNSIAFPERLITNEQNAKDIYHSNKCVSPPNPNISGLPTKEMMLTQYNVDMHSRRMERIRLTEKNTSGDIVYKNIYPTSQAVQENILNPACTKGIQLQSSSMSTEDLFAVIHNSKKRLNIKTDSDVSLASSSRSSSPSYARPTSARGTLAETGFLSPRNTINYEVTGDRRSWADFRSTEINERKSLASDRLGRTKPTSMHDFKMLLLQTRSNNKISGPRKSAVEMLRLPLSHETSDNAKQSPFNLSPRNSLSFSVQTSPSDLPFPSGHSTVPFKRGNRARMSLQSRYTIYPPIFEDCLEDSENCRDLTTQHSFKTLSDVGGKNGSGLQNIHATSNFRDNVSNSRHWI